ncbi:Methyl-CpG DNA binding,DNA-binding domain [Cinara cedri]|uniref:Methyl-CpG DNA binding,DNA-binding domain n=1 Tax=Cinara cedri TaxID=506608 RepID=A0A5E4NKD4_9HEMI|nr:Methyl-CpG DNA binding,DNA-binding domain [Cinara cedri]
MDPIYDMPFDLGWKREVVHRKKKPRIDIYYYAPDRKKLRSIREVHEYLDPRSPLKIHHFTFAQKALGLDPEKEIIRNARNPGVPNEAINIIEEQAVGLDIEEQNPIDIQPAVVRNPDVPDDAINIIEEQAVELDIEEQNLIDIQPAVVRNPGVPDNAINIIEEPAVGLDIEEQNPIDIQPAVVRNPGVPDGAINIIEEQAVVLDFEEQNPIDIQPARHVIEHFIECY